MFTRKRRRMLLYSLGYREKSDVGDRQSAYPFRTGSFVASWFCADAFCSGIQLCGVNGRRRMTARTLVREWQSKNRLELLVMIPTFIGHVPSIRSIVSQA